MVGLHESKDSIGVQSNWLSFKGTDHMLGLERRLGGHTGMSLTLSSVPTYPTVGSLTTRE